MPYNHLNVYPDSDFMPDFPNSEAFDAEPLPTIQVHYINGEAMVRLLDLEQAGSAVTFSWLTDCIIQIKAA